MPSELVALKSTAAERSSSSLSSVSTSCSSSGEGRRLYFEEAATICSFTRSSVAKAELWWQSSDYANFVQREMRRRSGKDVDNEDDDWDLALSSEDCLPRRCAVSTLLNGLVRCLAGAALGKAAAIEDSGEHSVPLKSQEP